jgi:MoaA/NifB/PqqE/SkfB family radical SAM enzyme
MRNTDALTKLYIEITTACNLDCQMCVRRIWDEPSGTMPLEVFRRLMDQVRMLPSSPTIHLGGYGEPMAHRDFLEIVRMAKEAGACVEVTTNGTLLTPEMSSALLDLDLNRLVVSIDGATPEHYENIREGGSFGDVIGNLRALWRLKMRRGNKHSNPQLGIAFVAMKQNIADLAQLPALAVRVGAWEIKVSNVVPHTREMAAEVLYNRSLRACAYRASAHVADLSLPKLDLNELTVEPVGRAFNSTASISLLDASLSARNDYCRFVQLGYVAIRWDGAVSPCLSLLHDHPEYILGRCKQITHYAVGNIHQQSLAEIWESAEYQDFRARLRVFPFSPCSTCGGCERFPRNFNDCQENTFPTCGGCLWAQGFIQCP